MKRLFLIATALSLSAQLPATVSTRWTFDALRDQARIVVIGTPTAEEISPDITNLPGTVVPVNEVTTTFDVLTVLKGDSTIKSLQLHHYKLADLGNKADPRQPPPPCCPPAFLNFKPRDGRRYLMFLNSVLRGGYVSVSGEFNPTTAVVLLGN